MSRRCNEDSINSSTHLSGDSQENCYGENMIVAEVAEDHNENYQLEGERGVRYNWRGR
jgi:hypothetical protein